MQICCFVPFFMAKSRIYFEVNFKRSQFIFVKTQKQHHFLAVLFNVIRENIDIYIQVTSVSKKCNFLSCWFASNRALVRTFLRGLLFVGFDKQILQYQGHHCYIEIRSVILQLSIALMFCWWACNWWSRRKGHLSIQAMHRE